MRVRLAGSAVVLALTGCVAAPPLPSPEPSVTAHSARPPPPLTKQVWQPAGWQRSGDDYVWAKARYVTVRVKHPHWVPAHHASDGTLVAAHWQT